jgi:protein-disulfide isomerase
MDKNGKALVLAACILGMSLVASSYMLGGAIDEFAATQVAIAKAAPAQVVAKAPAAAPSPSPAPSARRRGPDPGSIYKVSDEGAPTRGVALAQVTITEFSDFQ